MISQISPNYEYAPGIAMYGLPGKTGAQGQDANNIFFTDCQDLLDKEADGYQNITVQIQGGLEPIAGSTKPAERAYQVNDYFLSIDNFLYQLSEYGNDGQETNITFKKIACLNLNNNSASHFSYNNRLIYDSSFGGLSILNGTNDASSNAALYIDESRIDSNGNINFLQLSTITDNTNINSLFITYNVYNQAFMLTSEQPIVIDSPTLQVNRITGGEDFNEYTSVVLSDNPITQFKENIEKTTFQSITLGVQTGILWDITDALQYIESKINALYFKIYANGQTYIQNIKSILSGQFTIKNSQAEDIIIKYTSSVGERTGNQLHFTYQLSCDVPNVLASISFTSTETIQYDATTQILQVTVGTNLLSLTFSSNYNNTETINNIIFPKCITDPSTYIVIPTTLLQNEQDQIQLIGAVYNIEVYIKQEAYH